MKDSEGGGAVTDPMLETRVVAVIPCHNEAATLPSTVAQLVSSFSSSSGHRLEVLAVDDGSTDDTWAVIRSMRDLYPTVPVSGLRLATNQGKGMAQAIGIRATPKGSWLVLMDADGQHDPSTVVNLIESARANGTPCVAMRSNYDRRPTSAAGVVALRLVAGMLGIEFDPRESEFLAMPPASADAVRADQQLGVVPLLAVVHARSHPTHLQVRVQPRTGGGDTIRWRLADLWHKALLHLLSDPWKTLPRLAAVALVVIAITLAYGLWVGIRSVMDGTFLGVGSVIVLQAILFSCTVAFLLMIVGLLVTQFQSRVLDQGSSLVAERFGPDSEADS